MSSSGVVEEISGKLDGDQLGAGDRLRSETERFREVTRGSARGRDLGLLLNGEHHGIPYRLHLVILTVVPSPGLDAISNSSISLRVPLRPRPMPEPEVQPSVRAS